MPRFLRQFGFIALIVCAGLAALAATVRQPGFDPDSNCIGNARLIAQALQQYTQDYDEILPAMSHTKEFATALTPYNPRIVNLFDCPATGLPYQPNGKLSGQTLAQISNPDTAQIFRDTAPHPDGQLTIAYLSGRVDPNQAGPVDNNALCVSRAQQVTMAISQYTQDYDETFPPMTTQQLFQNAVYPYVKSTQVFICPATNYKYVPNPALNEVNLASITSPATTELFKDHKPHPDGIETAAYADGHVTHGDIDTGGPNPGGGTPAQCRENLRQLGLATLQYIQDYDEHYPLMDTYAHFEAATIPYTKNPAAYTCPDTGLAYKINSSLSGVAISTLPQPDKVKLVYDATNNSDGSLNTTYADGRVGTEYLNSAQFLVVGTDHKPALVWTSHSADNVPSALVWDLSSLGGPASTFSYNPQYSGLESQLTLGAVTTVHADQRIFELNFLPQVGASATSPAPGNGLIDVWGTSPTGVVITDTLSGPYDGWSVVAQSSGGTEKNHLLWRRYDGLLALWTLTSKGGYASDMRLTPPDGETVKNLVTGTDGVSYVLLSQADGIGDLWTIGADNTVQAEKAYNGGDGSAAVAVALTPANLPVLLFSDGSAGSGTADVRALDASGHITHDTPVYLDSGWTASQIVVGPDGNYWILWKRPGAESAITRFTAAGARVFKRAYSPYQ